MSTSKLLYSTSTGDQRRSENNSPAGTLIRDGGIELRLELEANRVYLGDVALDVIYVVDDPWDDIAAWFKVDCGYSTETASFDNTYEVKVYADHATVYRQEYSWDLVDDRPLWNDYDDREFNGIAPFLRYMQREVLPAYLRSREQLQQGPKTLRV